MVGPNDIIRGLDTAGDLTQLQRNTRSHKHKLHKAGQKDQSARQQIEELGGVSANHPAVRESSGAEKQAAIAAEIEAANKPTLTDKALGAAGAVVTVTGLFSFFGSMIVNALGGLVKGGGRLIGSQSLQKAGLKVQAPVRYINENSFADVGQKVGVGGFLGRASQRFANGAAGVVETVGNATGLSSSRHAANMGKAHTHFERTKSLAGEFKLDGIPAELRPHVEAIHQAALNSPSITHAVDKTGFRSAVTAAEEMMAQGGVKADKATRQFITSAGKSLGKYEAAEGWRNLGASVKAAPKSMAQSKISHGLLNGSLIAGSALSMTGDARSFFKDLKTLKQMYADTTGKKASTLRILLGGLPGPVAAARSHLIKNTLVKESTDAAGMLVNVKQAVDHRFNGPKALAAFFIPDFISRGADKLMGESLLSYYKPLSEAHKLGQAISAEDYAEFLVVASRDLGERGKNSEFTKAIAQQYAAAHTSPAVILQEVSNGGLTKRIALLIAANETAKDQTAHSPIQQVPGNKERPIVGKHTEQLAKSSTPTLEQGI
jgi:hypothetical protein